MANELQSTVKLRFLKDGASVQKDDRLSIDVTGASYESKTVAVGTVEAVVGRGEILDVGMVYLKNLDDTNFILAGASAGNYAMKLKPGESCMFRLNGNTLYLKADTASCLAEVTMIED